MVSEFGHGPSEFGNFNFAIFAAIEKLESFDCLFDRLRIRDFPIANDFNFWKGNLSSSILVKLMAPFLEFGVCWVEAYPL